MIKYQRFLLGLTVSGLLIAIVLLFIQQQKTTAKQDEYIISNYIGNLGRLDAKFEKQILLMESWHFRNYDNLNAAYDAYSEALFAPPPMFRSLQSSISGLQLLLEKKFQLVERLKSSNALARNSVNYLPTIIKKIYQELENARRENRINLKTESSFYKYLNSQIIHNLVARTKPNRQNESVAMPDIGILAEHVQQQWISLFKHVELMKKRQGDSRQTMIELNQIGIEAKIEQLNQQFSDHLKTTNQERQQQTLWLFVYLAVAVAVLLISMGSLRVYHRLHVDQKAEARTDPLTGLNNRRMLEQQFPLFIKQAQGRKQSLGIMFIDLDSFKQVNDVLGHNAGDELLQTIANNLLSSIREDDLLVRVGGDEFVLIIRNSSDRSLEKIANKALKACSHQFERDGHVIKVGASIGISAYPQDATDITDLLKLADAAMYQAKKNGKGCYFFYRQLRLLREAG